MCRPATTLFALFLGTPLLASDLPGTAEALEKSRAFLAPSRSSITTFRVREYENRRLVGDSRVKVLTRVEGGDTRGVLGVFLAPDRHRGKVVLQRDDRTWFRSAGADNPVEIGPRQRVMGRLTHEKLFNLTLLDRYRATEIATSEVPSPAGASRAGFRLLLAAMADSRRATSVELFVERDSFRPVLARLRDAGGRHEATIYYAEYREIRGEPRPHSISIVDGHDPDLVLHLVLLDMKEREMPAEWFRPSTLPSPATLIEFR